MLLILYALIGYPAFGYFAGHHYPSVPVFGVAPCPTTIFTIGGSAAVLLSVPQD